MVWPSGDQAMFEIAPTPGTRMRCLDVAEFDVEDGDLVVALDLTR